MTGDLCKYKDMFGKPNEGSHSYRIPIINLAVVDILFTAAVAYGINYSEVFMNNTWNSFWIILVILVIIGIIAHKAFCVDTQLNKYIFGEKKTIL